MRARILLAFGLIGAGLYGACVEHDYEDELGRSGGPEKTFDVVLPEAAPVEVSGPPVTFCEAFAVMRTCRCCHYEETPARYAPFRLFTYDDTQQFYGVDANGNPERVYLKMIRALESNFMPSKDPNITKPGPPAKALDGDCKQTLLNWLYQGAQPLGGQCCDPDAPCKDGVDIGCNPLTPPPCGA
jgi:hypothetical protein